MNKPKEKSTKDWVLNQNQTWELVEKPKDKVKKEQIYSKGKDE